MKKYKSLLLIALCSLLPALAVLSSLLPAPLYCQWLEATVPVGDNPWALVYNSIYSKVYCANGGGDDVTVIDGESDTVIKTITVGGSPGALAWNPIENRTYIANYWSNTVSVIRDSMIIGIEEDEIASLPLAMTNGVEIYPNPAKGVLRVRGPFSEKTIRIFDISGKMTKEIEIIRSVT